MTDKNIYRLINIYMYMKNVQVIVTNNYFQLAAL